MDDARALDRHRTAEMKPNRRLTVETRGAFRCVRFPSRGRQQIMWTTMIVQITIAGISIGRPKCFVEEHREHGPIQQRSRRDRAAIAHYSPWNLLHNHRMTVVEALVPRSTPDRGPIVARSWPDHGEKLGPFGS